MIKIIFSFLLIQFSFSLSYSKDLKILGLSKLSIEDIQVLSNVDLDKNDFTENEINDLFNKLYSSDLIYDVELNVTKKEYQLILKENKIVQNIYFNNNLSDKLKLIFFLRKKKFDELYYLQEKSNLFREIRDYFFFNLLKIKKINGFFLKQDDYLKNSETIQIAKRVNKDITNKDIDKLGIIEKLLDKPIYNKNYITISIGGFFIPKYDSFSSYFKRVVYRAGLRLEQTGLVVNNESIDELGISFGVGVPVGRLFSNANIGFEIGQRGTTSSNLVQENFFNISLSLSLNDRWFEKRKFN